MLEPANGEHTEFTNMVQVVNVKTDPSKEFEITEVTYSHPLGIKIENHSQFQLRYHITSRARCQEGQRDCDL